MISKVVLDTFRVVLRVGFKVGAFPYKWDAVNEELKPASRKKLWHWYCIAFYMFLNTGFMSVRLGQSFMHMENMSYGKLVMNLFNVATWTGASVFQLNTLIHREEVCQFINQVITTDKHLSKLNWIVPDTGKPESSSVRKFTYGIYFYSFCQLFISIRTLETNPKYWFSLLGTRGTAKWKLIQFGLFESVMSASIASMLLFYVFLFLSYVMLTRNCLDALRTRKSAEVPKYYRMLQVLNAQFTFCTETLVMPFVFLTLLAANMISTFATVRLFHEVKMPAFLGFPMIALATTFICLDTFPTSYKMYMASRELLRSIKKTTLRSTYLAKVMESCRLIGVDIGPFFVITQSTTMTFLGIAVDNTITLLLF